MTGFGGVGGLRGAGEVLAHGGIVHHEVDKRLVVGFVAGEKLAREGFDREGLAQIVDVEFGIGVVGAPIDESPEVFAAVRQACPGPRRKVKRRAEVPDAASWVLWQKVKRHSHSGRSS